MMLSKNLNKNYLNYLNKFISTSDYIKMYSADGKYTKKIHLIENMENTKTTPTILEAMKQAAELLQQFVQKEQPEQPK